MPPRGGVATMVARPVTLPFEVLEVWIEARRGDRPSTHRVEPRSKEWSSARRLVRHVDAMLRCGTGHLIQSRPSPLSCQPAREPHEREREHAHHRSRTQLLLHTGMSAAFPQEGSAEAFDRALLIAPSTVDARDSQMSLTE